MKMPVLMITCETKNIITKQVLEQSCCLTLNFKSFLFLLIQFCLFASEVKMHIFPIYQLEKIRVHFESEISKHEKENVALNNLNIALALFDNCSIQHPI